MPIVIGWFIGSLLGRCLELQMSLLLYLLDLYEFVF